MNYTEKKKHFEREAEYDKRKGYEEQVKSSLTAEDLTASQPTAIHYRVEAEYYEVEKVSKWENEAKLSERSASF